MNSTAENACEGEQATSDVLKVFARTAQEVLDAPQDGYLMEQLLDELLGSPSEDERRPSAPAET